VATSLPKTSPLRWSYAVPWRYWTGADFRRGQIARVDWMRKLFGKGATVVCCEGEEGAFSAKL
jgi:hypothetical protein